MITKIPKKLVWFLALSSLNITVHARSHRKHKELHTQMLEAKVAQLEGKVIELEKALVDAKKHGRPSEGLMVSPGKVASRALGEELSLVSAPDQVAKAATVEFTAGVEKSRAEAKEAVSTAEVVTADVVEEVGLRSNVNDKASTDWVMQDTEPALYRQITGLIGQKDYVRAESCAQSYIEKYAEEKNAATVLFWLGEMKMLFGDLREARVYYQQSLERLKGKGRTPEVLLKIAMIAYQKGENAEGDLYYEKLQNVYPGSTASHMARAQRKKYRAES